MTDSRFPKRNYAPRPKATGAAARRPAGDRRPPLERRPPGAARAPASDAPARPDPLPPAAAAPVPAVVPPQGVQAHTAWDRQATWYDALQGADGDDFYRELILPAVLKRLAVRSGERVLDLGCGQGVLGRALAAQGISSVGIDASPALIGAARSRAGALESHLLGDARRAAAILKAANVPVPFAHAALIMALQDLDPLAPVLHEVAAATAPGGRVVIALTHPCFRIPRLSSWGWDAEKSVQYRRMDGYMSAVAAPIRTHPGKAPAGDSTTSFHRPLSTYINACGGSGLAVTAADELCSHRRGTRGPKFGAEDRAAREFPLFIVLTCVRIR